MKQIRIFFSQKFQILVGILLFLFIFMTFSAGCTKQTPKLTENNLEGWSIRIYGFYHDTYEREFMLEDYVNTAQPIEITLRPGKLHNLGGVVCYKGEIQEDIYIFWDSLPTYSADGGVTWENMAENDILLLDVGEYHYYSNDIVYKDSISMGNGGTAYAPVVSFDLFIEISLV